MPYTRNTRIKVTKGLHSTKSEAQVEYRYPLTNITKWEAIDLVEPSFLRFLFCVEGSHPLPWKAHRDCLHDPSLDGVGGLEWAKALIDKYHKLFDEAEWVETVEFIKYPD